MSWSLGITSIPLRPFIHTHHHRHHHRRQNVTGFNPPTTIHTIFNHPPHSNPILCLSSHHSPGPTGDTVHGTSDSVSDLVEPEGSGSSSMSKDMQRGSLTTTKILEQLKRYGVAGILSYGLLNTVYYLTAFLVVWFYFAPVPGNMGYVAAATRFLKVMAMVWAGSQVTKLVRAAGYAGNFIFRKICMLYLGLFSPFPLCFDGYLISCKVYLKLSQTSVLCSALALAPFVDRGLSWFTVRFKFESRGKAFYTVVSFCLGLAAILFLVVTILWA